MQIRKKILTILCLTYISSSAIADCYQKSVFDDGENGQDVHLRGPACYDGNQVPAPGKGEHSFFGENGKSGNLYIDEKVDVFGGTLKTGEPANTYIQTNNSKSGNVYNQGNIHDAVVDTSNNSTTYLGVGTTNNSKSGNIYNKGSIENSKIDTSNNSKIYNVGIGNTTTINNAKSGNIYNDEVIINK